MKKRIAKLKQLPEATAFGSCLHLVLAFLCYFLLDLAFRRVYHQWCATWEQDYVPLLFSLCWSLMLCAVAFALPPKLRRIWLIVSYLFYAVLAATHGVFINLFSRFFSFADLSFAGDGAAFVDTSYLVIRKLTVFLLLVLAAGMVLAALLTPRRDRVRLGTRLGLAALALVVGGLGVGGVRTFLVGKVDGIGWDQTHNAAAIYENWSDTRPSLLLTGLYQYTWRDACRTSGIFDRPDPKALETLDAYFASRPAHEDNDMSGVFAGKNLLLVQLECIDTWMLAPEYMPALSAIKDESIVFTDFYTPGFISANTFNTEFIVNTGMLPAGPGISPSVYTHNAYPHSLARLFADAGYTSRSFHGIEGNIYDRLNMHANWGYERYTNGWEMGMENNMFDSQLTAGFDQYTAGDPFFSFLITYSGHGPFSLDSDISVLHYDEALAVVPEAYRDNEAYVCAVSNAMETDLFVAGLREELERSGRAEDTVVVFYADHYSTYLMDTELNMALKGADREEGLRRTDFFIWCPGGQSMTVDTPAGTPDVLPTLANLFGLDAPYACYVGADAFSPQAGFVFFNNRVWRDSAGFHEPGTDGGRVGETMEMFALTLKTDYFRR